MQVKMKIMYQVESILENEHFLVKKNKDFFFHLQKKCFQWGCYRMWVLQGKRSRLPGIFWIYSRPFWSRRDTWIALHSVLELALNYNVWQVFMCVVHCAWLILFKAHIFLFFWLACVRSFRSHIKVTLRWDQTSTWENRKKDLKHCGLKNEILKNA